jgi:6-pyruvoyl-tetrahydropterin synthase related domain
VFVRTIVPSVLLAIYAVAWGWAALGRGVPGADDHPGQLYRLIHAITLGPAPWHWNPGWWAGYPELQYYPPLFFYLGYALHWLALGLSSPGKIYLILVWLVFLLPGAATYAFLSRVLGSGWLALPAAFLALVISAGSRSGIEEGLRWGLVAARLGWGLLPLLALTLVPWLEGNRRPRALPALLFAAVVLAHPAHAALAVVLVLLAAAMSAGSVHGRVASALVVIASGLGIAAFWLLPLIVHLVAGPPMALPLAWADASLRGLVAGFASRPLLLVLLVLNLAGWAAVAVGLRPPRPLLWLQGLAPAPIAVTILDALIAEPTGLLWLPADRLVDGVILALILGGPASAATLVRAGIARYRWSPPWAGGIAVTLGIAAGIFLSAGPAGSREPTVSLWPRVGQWPTSDGVIQGYRFDALWDALARAPMGRVLFLRSAVPLEFSRDWWREHSHMSALTPTITERGILGGTFTHPSPVAAFFYAGLQEGPAALRAPIRMLAEQRDGVSVFGRDLGRLRPGEFTRLAAELRVSAVVTTDEDIPRLRFLTTDPEWSFPTRVGAFLVFTATTPRPLAQPRGPDRYLVFLAQPEAGWISTGVAWSPLWHAQTAGGSLPTRQGELGLLEVEVTAARGLEVTLQHHPGVAEWAGALVSLVAAAVLLLGRGWRPR